MATRQPRVPKTAATKPAAPSSPVAPAPVAEQPKVEEPVAAEPAPVEPAQAEPAPAAPTAPKKRQTPAEGIAPARVKSHIKVAVNGPLIEKIDEYKPKLNKLKAARLTIEKGTVDDFSSGKKTTRNATSEEKLAAASIVSEVSPLEKELVMKLAALQKEKIRLSLETPHALAGVLEYIINNLADFAYSATKKSNKKMIYCEHVHAPGIEDTPVYNLVCNLPSFVEQSKKVAESRAKAASDKLVAETKSRTEKQMKIDHNLKNIKAPKKKVDKPAEAAPAPAPAPVEPAPEASPAENVHEEHDRTSFKCYVFRLCKELERRNPDYDGIRVSTEIRSYFSDLCIQFIQACAKHIVQRLTNKTVDHKAVLNVAKTFLIARLTPTETLSFEETTEPSPEALKAELKAAEEAKVSGVAREKVKPEHLAQVPALRAVRTISYENSGYDALEKYVNEKVKAVVDAKENAEKAKKAVEDARGL